MTYEQYREYHDHHTAEFLAGMDGGKYRDPVLEGAATVFKAIFFHGTGALTFLLVMDS